MQQALTGDVFASITEHNHPKLIYEAAGQSVFAISKETTVAEQFEILLRDISIALMRLNKLTRQD